MPQRGPRLPLLHSFQRQATTVLAAVTKEINQREQELAALKAEAAHWQDLLREPAGGNGSTAPLPRKRAAKRRRLDWNAILTALPTALPQRTSHKRPAVLWRRHMPSCHAG